MRGLLQRMSATDADAVAALRVVSTFDDLLTSQAPLVDVAAVTAALVGVPVHVQDDWNGRRLDAPAPGGAHEDRGHEAGVPAPQDVPGHGAEVLGGRIVAPVSVAEGRIGVVWTDPVPGPGDSLMRLALERLAAAVAIDATRVRAARPASGAPAECLARLVGADGVAPAPAEAAELARRCGLDPRARHVVVAARAAAPLAGQALAAALTRALAGVTGAGLGRTAVLVAPGLDPDEVARVAAAPGVAAWQVRAGVADPAHPAALAAAWSSARHALSFADSAAPVVRAADLGVLSLLAELPEDAVRAAPDVRAVASLAGAPTGAEDLVLLRRYCETGSLRETAALVHRHHSSVDYRVKKIQAALGFALDRPAGRLRALLALRVWSLHHDDEVARGT